MEVSLAQNARYVKRKIKNYDNGCQQYGLYSGVIEYMSILFVILHSQHTKSRYEAIKCTWGKDQDCFFCSDYSQPPDIYQLTERSDHGSAELKHTFSFSHLLLLPKKYNWYFFCDDDTFVNVDLLINDLPTFDPTCVHGQAIQCWQPDTSLIYPSGGAGYLISSEVLPKMPSIVSYPLTGFSDVTFGQFIRSNGIILKDNDKFKGQLPSHYGISKNDIHKYYTFHYIKSKQELTEFNELVKSRP